MKSDDGISQKWPTPQSVRCHLSLTWKQGVWFTEWAHVLVKPSWLLSHSLISRPTASASMTFVRGWHHRYSVSAVHLKKPHLKLKYGRNSTSDSWDKNVSAHGSTRRWTSCASSWPSFQLTNYTSPLFFYVYLPLQHCLYLSDHFLFLLSSFSCFHMPDSIFCAVVTFHTLLYASNSCFPFLDVPPYHIPNSTFIWLNLPRSPRSFFLLSQKIRS